MATKKDSERPPPDRDRHDDDTYRTVAAFLPEILWETDATGKFVWTNRRGYELTGYSPADIERGINLGQIVAPEDVSRLHANVAALFTGAPGFAHEYKIRRKNGTTFPALVHSLPVVENGKVVGVRGILVDISEQRRSEQEIARSQRLLQSVFDAIKDGIVVLDRDLNIRQVNNTVESWYPDSRPFVGKKCYAALRRRKKPCDPCPARRALETRNVEMEVFAEPDVGTGPKWLELYAAPLVDAAGTVSGVVEYGRDITERKLAEEALVGTELALQSIIDNCPSLMWCKDREGRFVAVNQAFVDATSQPSKEHMIGKTDFDLWPHKIAETIRANDEAVMASRAQKTVLEAFSYASADIRVESHKSPVFDANGNVIGTVGFAREIEKSSVSLKVPSAKSR